MADDVEWLTLTEAAARLMISRDSVRRLVRRQHWARRPGNDGCVRVGVPVERFSRKADGPGAAPGSAPGTTPGPTPGEDPGQGPGRAPGHDVGREARIAALEATVAGLNALVAEAVRRADAADRRAAAAEGRADDLRQERDRWHEQAQRLAMVGPTLRSWWPWRRSA